MNKSSGPGVVKTVTNCVTGSISLPANAGENGGIKAKKKERQWRACLACNVDGATDLSVVCHPMESCSVWDSLQQREKESKVKCIKHPFK